MPIIKAALAEYDGLAPGVKTLLANEKSVLDTLLATGQSNIVIDTNLQGSETNVSVRLGYLGNAGYDVLSSIQKVEVAKHLIQKGPKATVPQAPFANYAAIEAALTASVTEYATLVNNLNTATDVTATETAITAITTEMGWAAYTGSTSPTLNQVATAVFNEKNGNNVNYYETIADMVAVLQP
ncbi:hypothetical protein [Sporosarcina sp. ZBG7A]|uniref:hypothetical protein n=1 Tax=Sporosarcina sp. ZBG7A TaxID=1582223 RepID=UPI0012E06C4C|nr:hypothetical protein [Sporosarcina sp. ZBG7A]